MIGHILGWYLAIWLGYRGAQLIWIIMRELGL